MIDLLATVNDWGATRAVVAQDYAAALVYGDRQDWTTINMAITERWSKSGLEWIKREAWKQAQAPRNLPRVIAEDVGSYWTRDDGTLWRIVTYCESPTVSWERVDEKPDVPHLPWRPTRRGGAVGSEITRGFIRLVEDENGRLSRELSQTLFASSCSER